MLTPFSFSFLYLLFEGYPPSSIAFYFLYYFIAQLLWATFWLVYTGINFYFIFAVVYIVIEEMVTVISPQLLAKKPCIFSNT